MTVEITFKKKKNKLPCDPKKVFPNASYFAFNVLRIIKYKYERKLFKAIGKFKIL